MRNAHKLINYTEVIKYSRLQTKKESDVCLAVDTEEHE